MSKPLVVWQSEIVDLSAPQELQQEFAASTKDRIEPFRTTPRAKHPIIKPLERRGRANHKCKLVHCLSTIIELVGRFQYHALIDIKALGSYFFHDIRVRARVDESKPTTGLPHAYLVAIQVAGRTLPIIDKFPIVIR